MAAEVLDRPGTGPGTVTDPATPRTRLWREFAARATTDRVAWLARTWARAVLMLPSGDDEDAVVGLLAREWAAYRTAHPSEPTVEFSPPPRWVPDETVTAGPAPYDALPPLIHGRYGTDLPSHEERVREEQERLARRDQAYYGF